MISQSFCTPLRLQGAESQAKVVEARLEALCVDLANLLGGCDQTAKATVLAWFFGRVGQFVTDVNAEAGREIANLAGRVRPRPKPINLTPEQLEWARKQYDEEIATAGTREIEVTGGIPLCDVLQELKAGGPLE